MKDKISVIIPVYNVSDYLERCLNSVINQTYNNLEIILVNDGSTDNSGAICDEFANKYNIIKVIHKKNGGLSDARNVGLKIATGKYIAFLDSDDWIDLDYYEKLYSKMIEYDSDISIIGFFWAQDNNFNKSPFYLEDKIFTSDEAINELVKDELLTSHVWNKLFKRELWNDIEFPYRKSYEDVFVMHKVFAKANKIAIISDFKHYYFMRNDSIIHTQSTKNLIDEFLAFKTRYDDLKDSYPHIKNYMVNSMFNPIMKMYCLYHLTNEEKKKYKFEVQQINSILKNREIKKYLSKKRKLFFTSPRIYSLAIKSKRMFLKEVKYKIKNIFKLNLFGK